MKSNLFKKRALDMKPLTPQQLKDPSYQGIENFSDGFSPNRGTVHLVERINFDEGDLIVTADNSMIQVEVDTDRWDRAYVKEVDGLSRDEILDEAESILKRLKSVQQYATHDVGPLVKHILDEFHHGSYQPYPCDKNGYQHHYQARHELEYQPKYHSYPPQSQHPVRHHLEQKLLLIP